MLAQALMTKLVEPSSTRSMAVLIPMRRCLFCLLEKRLLHLLRCFRRTIWNSVLPNIHAAYE